MSLPISPETFELTMEKEFVLVRYNQKITEILQEDLRIALLETTRQLMIKDNVIRRLVKAEI
jgi:hypothetical protein